MLKISHNRQQGLTIAELLVGMAVGLLVMLAVTTVYINTLRTSANTLDGSRLNQEMAAIMNIMVNDIRRAHYWGGASDAFTCPTASPFVQVENAASAVDITALRIHNNGGSGTTYNDVTYDANGFVSTTANDNISEGSCITYTYDANSDGEAGDDCDPADSTGFDNDNTPEATDGDDDDEEFGFRWDGWPGRDSYSSSTRQGLILMRITNNDTGPSSCGDDSGRFGQSQGSRHIPWSVTVGRDQYVTYSDTPLQALDLLDPYLAREVQQELFDLALAR